VHLHYSAPRGVDTGVTEEDLDILWKTLMNLFEHDHASGRGEMDVKGLYVFSHDDATVEPARANSSMALTRA